MSRLDQACGNREPLSEEDLKYWRTKFSEFREKQEQDKKKETWNWGAFDLTEFLKRIAFEKLTESDLSDKMRRFVVRHYGIAEGNEEQYLRALYWNVFLWSRDRAVVRHKDVVRIVEAVKEDIAKGPANPAVGSRWLSRVSFEPPEKESRYFEGKPARPHDIAAGLPATRKRWEREILDAFEKADITLIRASSGQGKSTLAWQTAFHLVDNGRDDRREFDVANIRTVRLSEIRKRLSKEEKKENSWRLELERECERIVNENMEIVGKEDSRDVLYKYRALIEDVVVNGKVFEPYDFQGFFMEDFGMTV